VGGESSWRNLSELDLLFARSRRRASVRRREPTKRSPLSWRSVRAVGLAIVLLAVVAESIGLESSNAKPPAATAKRPAPSLDPSCPVPARFRPAFAQAAAESGLPASLLVATAYQESEMNPAAHSEAGAEGLLQLMPGTARELNLEGGGPAVNVLAGARYLREMLDRFGSVDLALAAYNAGPTAVERAGAAPTLSTLRYVKNVESTAALFSC
jgi:soluble lytic murein transglycosylase-like protein